VRAQDMLTKKTVKKTVKKNIKVILIFVNCLRISFLSDCGRGKVFTHRNPFDYNFRQINLKLKRDAPFKCYSRHGIIEVIHPVL